jgi:hypothetical protein
MVVSMVFLVLQPGAVVEALRLAQQAGCAVWVGSEAVTQEQHQQLTRSGVNVTRFPYPLANASAVVIEDAVNTIKEHHPDEVIWVQHV